MNNLASQNYSWVKAPPGMELAAQAHNCVLIAPSDSCLFGTRRFTPAFFQVSERVPKWPLSRSRGEYLADSVGGLLAFDQILHYLEDIFADLASVDALRTGKQTIDIDRF